ncbi:MAG: prepilin-type N-terminal cleavage/methylation domain-containing protein [Gemmatimonadota bacterium]|nr:MAG: prepilin-type N-terminal cleavage/methylation domain-containing protein [Gemmatimonadota bacterium]
MIGPYMVPLAQITVVRRAAAVPRALLAYRRRLRRRYGKGFTLVELMLTMTIIGTLATIAMPRLQTAVEKARIAHAIGDIRTLQVEIDGNNPLPANLAAIGRAGMVDPWGNPYMYVYHGGNRGMAKKDRFQVPLNTEYDLYSAGKDGVTSVALTAPQSQDDIVRANDGWVGLGSEF